MHEISDFESSRIAVFMENTKVLISCAVTVQMICSFVFAYARFLLHLIYNKTDTNYLHANTDCSFLCK